MDVKKQSEDKKITLTVTVKGDSFTDEEQRDILQELATMSHSLYLELATKIKSDKTH